MFAADEDVDASVAVKVAEDRVARVTGARETQACWCLCEGPVEIVTVHGALTVPEKKQVQVAVVIEVDEDSFARSFDVSKTRFRSHLGKCPIAAVAEKVSAAFATDDEEVQPAIVVKIRESRKRGALRK